MCFASGQTETTEIDKHSLAFFNAKSAGESEEKIPTSLLESRQVRIAHLDEHLDDHLDVEFIMVAVLLSFQKSPPSTVTIMNSTSRWGFSDVHLESRYAIHCNCRAPAFPYKNNPKLEVVSDIYHFSQDRGAVEREEESEAGECLDSLY